MNPKDRTSSGGAKHPFASLGIMFKTGFFRGAREIHGIRTRHKGGSINMIMRFRIEVTRVFLGRNATNPWSGVGH